MVNVMGVIFIPAIAGDAPMWEAIVMVMSTLAMAGEKHWSAAIATEMSILVVVGVKHKLEVIMTDVFTRVTGGTKLKSVPMMDRKMELLQLHFCFYYEKLNVRGGLCTI